MFDRDSLDAAVARAESRYAALRPRSARLAAEAATWMPGGNTRSVLHFEPFPFRISATDGPYLIDVDGHRYLDLLGNYTAGLLGHHTDETERVLKEAAARSLSIGAIGEDEADAARLLCERFPSVEHVRLTNSGTEANLMAIATAVHHTGRSKIVACHGAYHGGVLYFGITGRPLLAPYDWVMADFNDTASFHAVFSEHGDDIACVLIEPMLGAAGCIPPAHGFLETVRRLCTRHGALLVFDEVMTSRLSSGGAQLRFGVHPDLTTLGKYLAGGFNFGAFGGSRSIMAAFDPGSGGALAHGGTFNNNPLTIAGVRSTLGHVLTTELLDDVNGRGDRLRTALADMFTESRLPVTVTGLGSLMNVHGRTPAPQTVAEVARAEDAWKALLFFHLLERGFYMARRGFISLSADIDESHVGALVEAVAEWLLDPLGADEA